MYIYLIKYNGSVIAAAENDERASEVILQYIRNTEGIDKSLFEKESIRFFSQKKSHDLWFYGGLVNEIQKNYNT